MKWFETLMRIFFELLTAVLIAAFVTAIAFVIIHADAIRCIDRNGEWINEACYQKVVKK